MRTVSTHTSTGTLFRQATPLFIVEIDFIRFFPNSYIQYTPTMCTFKNFYDKNIYTHSHTFYRCEPTSSTPLLRNVYNLFKRHTDAGESKTVNFKPTYPLIIEWDKPNMLFCCLVSILSLILSEWNITISCSNVPLRPMKLALWLVASTLYDRPNITVR